MALLLWVALGGAGGTLARWGIQAWFAGDVRGPFPWGTFVVNLAGCLVLGILTGLVLRHAIVSPALQLGLTTGFCGGFTTFSTFNLETLQLFQARPLLALTYAAGSVILGLGSLWVGLRLVGQ